MTASPLHRLLNGRAVVVIYLNFGPYHVARLRAIAEALRPLGARLVAVELAGAEKNYPWSVPREQEPFEWRTLVADQAVEVIDPRTQAHRIVAELDRVDPVAVVVHGWSHPVHRAAAAWLRRRRRAHVGIMCGDSTKNTRRQGFGRVIARKWYLELYKRWLLRGFDAAFVSGDLAQAYFESLGMPSDRIFLKVDVVGNRYFLETADATRAERARFAAQYRTPERFFFFPSRLLELKNHLRLVDAYARYAERAGERAWHLLFVGGGPMEGPVDARIAALGDPRVQRRPFAQIEDVARYYGLASALIFPSWSETWGLIVNEAAAAALPLLVSDNCPVSRHLVVPGENGWTFDPLDVEALAQAMHRMSSLPDDERERLGAASRRIVDDWDVDDHARELLRAIEVGARRIFR